MYVFEIEYFEMPTSATSFLVELMQGKAALAPTLMYCTSTDTVSLHHEDVVFGKTLLGTDTWPMRS
jgi:hypothetical protein